MSEVELTPEQVKAIDLAARRLQAGVELTTLFGVAGTGKSTVAARVAERLGGNGKVAFCAPTGKAALVLRNKGVPASTVHSLIYIPIGASRKKLAKLQELYGKTNNEKTKEQLRTQITELLELLANPRFILKEVWEGPKPAAIVLDESSMVSGQMLDDLLSFKIPLLALGDPAQLPPVKATSPLAAAGYQPSILLEQMHRFALDSPVCYFATRVRERGPRGVDSWRDGSGLNLVESFNLDVGSVEKLLEYDQVICGRNDTRQRLNAAIRAVLGYAPDDLDDADRMVCLRNEPEYDLINGEQYTISELYGRGVPETDIMQIEGFCQIPLFTWAYAITCHKAQGSEWGRVVIFDESAVFGRDASKWLYTAITRAADEAVVLRMRG